MKKSSKKKSLMLSLIAITLPLTGCTKDNESVNSSSSSSQSSSSQTTSKSESTEKQTQNDPLKEKKEQAIAEVENYKNKEDYRDEEASLLQTLINSVKDQILTATTEEEINTAVSDFKAAADALETKAGYEAKEKLEKAKKDAIAMIEGYVSLDDYREAEKSKLSAYISEYKEKINAITDITLIDGIVSEFKSKVDELKTASQYEKEELDAKKNEALSTVESYVDEENYRSEEKTKIAQLKETATAAIQSATTIEEVETALNSYKENVDALKTDAKYKEEEAKALEAKKKAAETEINDYKNPIIYRKAEEDKYFDLVDEYVALVKKATSIDAIDDLIAEFKTKVDALALDTGFTGTLDNGAIVSFTASETDIVSDVKVMPDVHDWTGDGIAFRIKNNTSMTSYIGVFINEMDSDRVSLTTGATYYAYSVDGTKVSTTSGRSWGHYINLTPDFDGYIYIPYTSFAIESGYGTGDKTFNYSSVYGMFFETAVYKSYGDYNQNYTLGDFQVLNGSTIKDVLTNTSTTSSNFTQKYVADYNGDYIKLTFNGEITDPTTLPFSGTLNGGADVSFKADTTDGLATMLVKGQTTSWGGDGVILRIKNNTAIESFIDFRINETDSDRAKIKTNGEFTLYDLDGNATTRSSGRDWNSYIYLPASFDGYIYVPYSILEFDNGGGDNNLTFASVWGIYLGTSKQYDSYQNYTLGSIIVKNGDTYTTVLDPENLTDDNYSSYYNKDGYSDFISITRHKDA